MTRRRARSRSWAESRWAWFISRPLRRGGWRRDRSFFSSRSARRDDFVDALAWIGTGLNIHAPPKAPRKKTPQAEVGTYGWLKDSARARDTAEERCRETRLVETWPFHRWNFRLPADPLDPGPPPAPDPLLATSPQKDPTGSSRERDKPEPEPRSKALSAR